ncbi:AmmeMemoRadiSam system protein B [Candidatus Woesearchaeota archaeon]|nr:AmmeMemoRadiSam system protein B [Candidatus Woesearchaeota archaeon]
MVLANCLQKKTEKEILGAIAPHAGYMFSGPCAAFVYKEIAESKLPDLFIMLGLDHTGFGDNCVCLDDWQTPLGVVKTDKEFGKELEKNGIPFNPEAHFAEHSIEVQLPFLQFIFKEKMEKIRIVPVMITHDYKEVAEKIKKTIAQSKKRVCIIASSDFTHYGPSYGFTPFTDNPKENLEKLDKGAVEQIKSLEPEKFLSYAEKTTICGMMPIAVLMELLKEKAKKVELLKYYTSGDITKDYRNAVGYASIIFK